MSTIVTRAGKGSALTWTEGDANITNLNNDKIEDIVEDTSPQLGGDLDVNGKNITSASNGNINIIPNGSGNINITPATGKIVLGATDWPAGAGSAGQVLTTSGGTGVLSWETPASGGGDVVSDTSPQLGGDLDVNGHSIVSTSNGNINITPGGSGNINLTPATGHVTISATNFPTGAGSNGQFLQTDGTGNASWTTVSGGASALDDLSDVVITAAATNDVLVYNGTNWVDTAANTLTVSAASTATTATGATNININTTTGNSNDTTLYPVFVAAASTGNQLPHIDSSGLSFNATTNSLTLGATSATNSASIQLWSNGSDSMTIKAADSMSASYTLTLPADDGSSGGLLQTNGSGTLSWSNAINSTSIGATTASTGRFTTVTSTATTGTAPFTVASTTNVANLNASSLNGATFAAPGTIGSTTASTGAFTALSASSTVSGTGFSTYLASPPAIGATASNTGDFTTLTVDSGNDLRLNNTANTFYVGFKAGTLAASKIWTLPTADGTSNQVLTTDGAGNLSWSTSSGSAPSATTTGSATYYPLMGTTNSAGAITFKVEGAGLLSYDASTSTLNVINVSAGTGTIIANTIKPKQFQEVVYTLSAGSGATTLAPNVNNGSVQSFSMGTATSLTLNAFTSPVAGQSVTIIVTNNGTVTTISSTMKWAGGLKALTGTNGTIDIITIYYDGTYYYASIGKGYA